MADNLYNDYGPQINDNGQLAWYGDNGSGNEIFIASPSEPIPEPTTMLLLGSGLVGLTGFRRKLKKI